MTQGVTSPHHITETLPMAPRNRQFYQPSPRYRIIWESIKELIAQDRGDITIGDLEQALERLTLRRYEEQTPLSEDDWAQVDNTVVRAVHIHFEGK